MVGHVGDGEESDKTILGGAGVEEKEGMVKCEVQANRVI